MELRVRGVAADDWHRAVVAAKGFAKDYPDRMGTRNGVVYDTEYLDKSVRVYVYRTKTAIVVVAV